MTTQGFTQLLNSYAVLPMYALSEPSDTQAGCLGQVYNVATPDVPGNVTQFIYLKSHAALTAGVPYQVTTGVDGSEWITEAVPDVAKTNSTVVVPIFSVASGQYFYGVILGEVTAAVTGTVAVGDYVKLVKNTSAFAPNGTSGSTTNDSKAIGIILDARTGAGDTRIRLCGGFLTANVVAS